MAVEPVKALSPDIFILDLSIAGHEWFGGGAKDLLYCRPNRDGSIHHAPAN
jgi:hypothetical protein